MQIPPRLPWPLEAFDNPIFRNLGVSFDLSPEVWHTTFICGFLDIVPIGTIRGEEIIALRAQPGRPLSACPVVVVHPGYRESNIVSDSLAGFLPMFVFEQLSKVPTELWDGIAGCSDADWEGFGVLHQAVGGRAHEVAVLRQVLANAQYRHVCTDHFAYRDGEETWAEAMALVSAGRPRAAFIEFGLKVWDWEARPDPDPEVLRGWTHIA